MAISNAGANATLSSPTSESFGFATLKFQLVNYTPDMVGKEVTYGLEGAFLAINRMTDEARIEADVDVRTQSSPLGRLCHACA